MEIYTATLIIQKHINWQNDKINLPKVNEEKLKEATNLLTELVKKLTLTDVVQQREPFKAFLRVLEEVDNDNATITDEDAFIDEFLKSL